MSFIADFIADNLGTFGRLLEFLMLTVGLFYMFPKLGVRSRWALIPVVRYYKLAQSVEREDAGFIMAGSMFLSKLMTTGLPYVAERYGTKAELVYTAFFAAIGFISFIYGIRVYLALCHTFGKKNHWVLGWIFFDELSALTWGLSSKYKVEEQRSAPVQAAPDSGMEAMPISEGLTVNLTKRTVRNSLQRKILLKDIHLNLQPGRMVMLLGGSGAGKTTLINAIIGYEQADAEILLNGKNVYEDYASMLYEIALVPQQDLIRYDDTVIRTLADAAVLRLPENVSRRDRIRRIYEVLEIFGLSSVRNSQVDKLSGGQRKRLSIAMEYISDPSLFVLDEPDSGLDGVLARDLMFRLQKISRQGKIVVVITHSPDRVSEFFDDIIVLAKDAEGIGRLVFSGPISEALSFFEKDKLEDIVKSINRPDEGGDGRSDELIEKFAEVYRGKFKS